MLPQSARQSSPLVLDQQSQVTNGVPLDFGIPGEPATGIAWLITFHAIVLAHPAAYAAGSPGSVCLLDHHFTIPCIFIHSAQRAGHVAQGLPSLRRPKPWPPVL